MNLGFFFDLRNPPGWERPWQAVYAQALERIEAIERFGGGAVWFTEHHLWEDGYLPQPLVAAAAAAARTSRIRIGTAILLAPLRHPLHLAEEAAVVDNLSGGRLELGLGAGWSRQEFAAFGVDRAARLDATEAALVEVRRLLAESVTPPPVQNPLPLWLGFQDERGARRAGELGAGLLSLDRNLLQPYLGSFVAGGGAPRMGGLVNLIVADDPEEARERLLPHVVYQVESYRRERRPHDPITTVEEVRRQSASSGRWPSGPGVTVCTTDAAVAELTSRTQGMPVEHVYVWASIAGMPDDLVERHIELMCTRVAPELHAL